MRPMTFLMAGHGNADDQASLPASVIMIKASHHPLNEGLGIEDL